MPNIRPIPKLVVTEHDPGAARRWGLVLGVLWLGTVLAAWFISAEYSAPRMADLRARIADVQEQLDRRNREVTDLRERLAVAERADQVSSTAGELLQQTLAEREEELAALRLNLAFYQRLVGSGAERRGLTVHDLRFKPIGDSDGWAFELTLTQNLQKGALVRGEVALSIEGVRNGRIERLDWPALTQTPGAKLAFGFKYFQALTGSIVLPEGYTPNQVAIIATAEGGDRAERTIAWADALAQPENDDVGQ
jgi:hypothetical protein